MERLVSHSQELRRMVVPMCTESPPMMQFCMQLYNLFYGPNTDLGPVIILFKTNAKSVYRISNIF